MKFLPTIQTILPALASALACHLLPVAGMAQYKFDKAIYLNKESGLPANTVGAISKGPDGFIWAGTAEGLCRFDGQRFKVYQKGNDLRYSLFDNIVNAVLPIKDEVWVATNQGISVLHTPDGTFRHYQLDETGKTDSLTKDFNRTIYTLKQDRAGDIWVGTRNNGAWRYDRAKDDFQHYPYAPAAYPNIIPLLGSNSTVLSIEPCNNNDSIVWVGTAGGLQEINKFSGAVRWYVFPQANKDYQVAVNAFRRLYHHTDGLLYVGGWLSGMHIFDPVTKTLRPLPVSERWQAQLRGSVSGISRKSDHEIWITSGAGLLVYDTGKKDITWWKLNNALENIFYGVNCIDEHNRVWFGNINGIQYFDPAMQQFTRYSFRHLYGLDWAFALYVDSDPAGNIITVCPIQADGLYVLDKRNGNWTKLPFRGFTAFEKLVVRGFALLPDGNYAISSDVGLFIYNMRRHQLQAMPNKPSTRFNRWGNMLLDKKGRLWISADVDGLICWDLRTGKYRSFNQYLRPNDTTRFSPRVVSLFEDSRHNIWFARNNGLGVYIAGGDSVINFLYTQAKANSFPSVTSFAEDRTGRVWTSSSDGWIGYALAASPRQGIVRKLSLPDRKIEGIAYSLTSDPKGNVWGYTDKLILQVHAGDTSITTFNFKYGIEDADFYYFSFLPSGEMIFGGRNDIVLTKPADLQRNDEVPVPYISDLEVLNQPYTMPPLFRDTALKLSYSRNFFTVGFSAQAYTLAAEVRFRYRLQNFDDWKEVTGNNFATYTNVPPGTYTFQLQAANNEGIWNPHTVNLSVHIATPWWQTWWFRLAVVLALAGFLYWLYRFRIGQVRKKEQLKSQYEKKLANVEMSALLAQMNPHFLFNSLNSIDSYIIKNESKKASEYLNNFARLMRLILQHSRSNYISLKEELETLELYLQMEGLRFRDQFCYDIQVNTQTDAGAIVIPPMLIQPYVENAIWHGLMHKQDGSERKLELLIEERDNNLFCVIQDNGIGRSKAKTIRLQKMAEKKRSMGMQITRDRIEIINKLYNTNTSITITDLKDAAGNAAGTRVELVIPV